VSVEETVPGFGSRRPDLAQDSRLPRPFEVFVNNLLGQTHVLLIGELDLAAAPLLASKLRDIDPNCNLVIDIALLTFVDSTGVGVLVMEHKRLQAHGCKLTIYAPTPRVQRILEITGLDQVFTIEP
jgi:anti-sigma B factor antagonist